jgi:RHS repeat-associated protein
LEKRTESAKAAADYKFTGKERDLESGLQYFEARYYSGTLGRFNRVDPLKEIKDEWLLTPKKFNCYSYCENNPIGYIDINGYWAKDTHLDRTHASAQRVGFSDKQAWIIAKADNHVDFGLKNPLPIIGKQEYHFDICPSPDIDSRSILAERHMEKAKDYLKKSVDFRYNKGGIGGFIKNKGVLHK